MRYPRKHFKAPCKSICNGVYWSKPPVGQPELYPSGRYYAPAPNLYCGGRTVIQAMQIMRHNGVDSLLVVDKKHMLLGLVRLEDLIGKQGSDEVETYLTDDYIAVEGETSLKEIISTIDYGVSGVIPVISHSGVFYWDT